VTDFPYETQEDRTYKFVTGRYVRVKKNKIQTLDFPQICGRTEGNRLGRFQVQSSRLPGSGRQSLTLRAGYDAAESVEFGRWFKFGFRNHKCAFNRCPISRNHPIFYFPRLLLHKSTQTLLSAVIRCRRHSSHLARIRKAGSRRQTESPRTTESWRLPRARIGVQVDYFRVARHPLTIADCLVESLGNTTRLSANNVRLPCDTGSDVSE